jgi:hypothetical protein
MTVAKPSIGPCYLPALPAALLAVLLLAATVDPRLAEPLKLLAEVGARESIDDHSGQFYADLPELLDLTLTVAALPRGGVGYFDNGRGTLTIADSVIGEDPHAVAVILAHELQHALDMQRVVLNQLEPDCLVLEVRGFEAEAITARRFWSAELPGGTPFERRIAAIVTAYERDGVAGLVARITGDDRYRESCARWPG